MMRRYIFATTPNPPLCAHDASAEFFPERGRPARLAGPVVLSVACGMIRFGYKLLRWELIGLAGAVVISVTGGCGKPLPSHREVLSAKVSMALDRFAHQTIGRESTGHPAWMAHVVAVDLDQDGLMDAVAVESQDYEVLWLRQVSAGVFEERVVGVDLRAPVQVHPADMDEDGDLDLIVSSMGEVYPNNDRIGTLHIL
ncbi:MAG: VCBS repeat-containing protein [Candidatus Synoicihabitans palmerolidicus]|nr:VCBS repeat-containing protein [Candidatus Synoicihabitans palmerolidicus]